MMSCKTILTGLVCLVFSCFSLLNAQKNLTKGYIITTDGQQIEGYINSNDMDVYSRLVAFKVNKKSGELNIYQPDKLQEFGIDNISVYHPFNIDFDFITKGGMKHHYEGARNLRMLAGSEKLSLYELNDIQIRAWFLKKEGQPLQFLSIQKKLNPAAMELVKGAIADCDCIEWDDTLPMKITHVGEVIQEYHEIIANSTFEEEDSRVGQQ